jgi:hypothetical protein
MRILAASQAADLARRDQFYFTQSAIIASWTAGNLTDAQYTNLIDN